MTQNDINKTESASQADARTSWPGKELSQNTSGKKENGLKLEVGKRYLKRNGEIVRIEFMREGWKWPYVDDNYESYTEDGQWDADLCLSDQDIVAPYEPKRFAPGEFMAEPSRWVKTDSNPKDLIGVKKPPLSLIPGAALVHCAMAFKNGAEKYTPYNWRSKKVQAMIYCDAIERHLRAYIDREDHADDSGLLHLAHIMSSAAVLIDAIEGDHLIDNRPPAGKTADVIRRYTEC